MKIQNFNTKQKIFLIAEIGNNHEGNFKVAKKLILLAKIHNTSQTIHKK